MANMGLVQIGDPLQVEGIPSSPEEDDDTEVTLIGVGPLVMKMKEMMMPLHTVKMAIGAHIDLGDLGVLRTL